MQYYSNKLKIDLSRCKEFTARKAFNAITRGGTEFIDCRNINQFMYLTCKNETDSNQPTKKRVFGLMRRMNLTVDKKLTFGQFGIFIKPQQLEDYIERVNRISLKGREPCLELE